MTFPDLYYLAVNWKDGMKLTQEHFVAQDNHLHDVVRDASWSTLNEFNFGLLPASAPNESVQLDFLGDELVVKNCKALTVDGVRVNLSARQAPLTSSVLSVPEDGYGRRQSEYYVCILIDPFTRVGVGEVAPQTEPPQFPNVQPKLSLQLIDKAQLETNSPSQNWLPVGKVRIEGNGWRLDKAYIPPCTKLIAHPSLREFHILQGNRLEELIEKAIKVSKNARSIGAGQDLQLAQSIGGMAEKLLATLATSFDYYSLYLPHLPPIALVLFFKQLARTLTYYLKALRDTDRESMFLYIKDNTGKEYAVYNSCIEAVQKTAYLHTDIYPALTTIDSFISVLNTLFDTLEELSFVRNASVPGTGGFWR